jgi:putative mRNA 3-end processing factor
VSLLTRTGVGLYCARGGFTIDPMRAVGSAIVTHAHSDHARSGSAAYWAAAEGEAFLRHRLGADLPLTAMPYGVPWQMGDTMVSLHPAGHVRGAAQVRIACDGEVWVVTGDYKRRTDHTCTPFEPVPCDVLVSEATFALPIYRWPDTEQVVSQIYAWWQQCRARGRNAVLFTYALGKAQRVLSELTRHTTETVYLHGAVAPLTDLYRADGVAMVPTERVPTERGAPRLTGALIIAPPSAARTPWMRRLAPCEEAFASGWMQIRGNRRRRGFDRGFVLSDHIDWNDLLDTIRDCGAKQVLLTHGDTRAAVRYLVESGVDAADLHDALPLVPHPERAA